MYYFKTSFFVCGVFVFVLNLLSGTPETSSHVSRSGEADEQNSKAGRVESQDEDESRLCYFLIVALGQVTC